MKNCTMVNDKWGMVGCGQGYTHITLGIEAKWYSQPHPSDTLKTLNEDH